MRGFFRAARRSPYPLEAALYAAVAVLLWPFPLVGLLHAESSAVVAFASFFVAGIASVKLFRRGETFRRVLLLQEALLLVPWAGLTLSLLWRPNCGYATGLLLFALFPPVTVAFAVSLAYAVAGRVRKGGAALIVGAGVLIAAVGPVYDIGFFPQFYTYNHVFGGVLGPIYDEELALRAGLFAFRGLTLLWALLFYHIGVYLHEEDAKTPAPAEPHRSLLVPRWGRMSWIGSLMVLAALVYLFAGRFGINTTATGIQQALGTRLRTPHFDFFYDAASLTEEEVGFLALDAEYQFARLEERLGVAPPERVVTYLYPDDRLKAALTGAAYTSVTPVWLSAPQMHLLQDAYEATFAHELAHVFSRSFGLPILHAALNVGMVEGLAVALEPPDGLPSPHEQVRAEALRRHAPGAITLADDLARTISPAGFWAGRGAVSYTTTGSFIRFLLDRYGAERLKRVYARGDFVRVYGLPIDSLAAGWQQFLLDLREVDPSAEAVATRRFAVPSLLEKPCPHYVPRHRRLFRRAALRFAAGDSVAGRRLLRASLDLAPRSRSALALWADEALARGSAAGAPERLGEEAAGDAGLERRVGDAWALIGRADSARVHYARARAATLDLQTEAVALLALRKALADHPDAVRVLVSSDAPERRAARMETVPGAAARMMQALEWARAGAYERAVDALESFSAADLPLDGEEVSAVERQRLVWLAQFQYRSGRTGEAQESAREAADAFDRAGMPASRERMRAFGQKLAWVERVETERLRGASVKSIHLPRHRGCLAPTFFGSRELLRS